MILLKNCLPRCTDCCCQGHITEADLAAFAETNSLPKTYVRPFLEAVLQHQQEQQQQGFGALLEQDHTEEDEVRVYTCPTH